MKFASFSLLALGLSSSVLASPTRTAREATVVERDLATMTSVISDISDQVGNLHDAINSWSGGDIDPVQSASDKLISTIKEGTETAKGSDKLSDSEAFSLTKPVQDLVDKVQSTISDLVDKKSKVVDAGAGGIVLSTLKEQKAAAEGLADAITSKVPESFKSLANKLASQISGAIQKGIDAYKGTGGSGGSTTTGGSSTPTETGGSGGETGGASTTPAPTTTGGAGGAGGSKTTSGGVIPTSSAGGSGGASSSGAPSPSGSSGSGSGSGSGSSSSSAPGSTYTGAASKSHMNFGLGAVAAVAAFAL